MKRSRSPAFHARSCSSRTARTAAASPVSVPRFADHNSPTARPPTAATTTAVIPRCRAEDSAIADLLHPLHGATSRRDEDRNGRASALLRCPGWTLPPYSSQATLNPKGRVTLPPPGAMEREKADPLPRTPPCPCLHRNG